MSTVIPKLSVLSLVPVVAAVSLPFGPAQERFEPEVAAAAPVDSGSDDVGQQVVVFDDEATTVDEVTAAVEAFGGEVIDVLEPLGLALVDPAGVELVRGELLSGTTIAGFGAQPIGHSPEPVDVAPGGSGARSVADPVAADIAVSELQWGHEMIGATADTAHRVATGEGVRVGVIDTGIDGTHPDLAPNLDRERSRDFVDGGSADVDPHGHGTHVAGIVAAADDGWGLTGVAPDATLVNLRAGNEDGYFFAYEVSSALVAAGDLGLDVVVMSFYTDPWLYNCPSADAYVSGAVTEEEIAEQALIRRVILDALAYAAERGVTLVAAAGNSAADMSAPHRQDDTSPDFPPGRAQERTVTSDCLDLPAEAPGVVTVSAVGPSGVKADYANHGLGSIDLVAPGGWHGDHAGTPMYRQPQNMVLSTYPLAAARGRGLVDGEGRPLDGFAYQDCRDDECGTYVFSQGTSMAAPFVAGAAALVIEDQRDMAPVVDDPEPGDEESTDRSRVGADRVVEILTTRATSQPCPAAGTLDYTNVGRPPSWNAPCVGTTQENSLYGRGIVDAAAAVGAPRP